ncbi:uncharacterized protein BJ171DRAFT_597707 [Polychytrium aggregatum]|uniref:uncharacterized protein n=1 Tax=Polychytrium aggregatum TaxID=110093 RepID=UPI0022FEC426|nr:uncharacterized protein BJ171DRAFT_597707 [Polychytrium aggregatum]KAI9206022.1 hypothetical protein BJ171DRAFT_597707 [Polychytrium aggregatum]
MSLAIVVLLGLPGAGKSTLCDTLVRSQTHSHVVVLAFDRLFQEWIAPDPDSDPDLLGPADAEASPLAGALAFPRIDFKDARMSLVALLDEHIIPALLGQRPLATTPAVAPLMDRWLSSQSPVCSCLAANESRQSNHANRIDITDQTDSASQPDHLIVIDDNNYYLSMRRAYYEVAFKYRLSYVQLFLPCPLDVALDRNLSRPCGQRVSDRIIQRMWDRFELPQGCPDSRPREKQRHTNEPWDAELTIVVGDEENWIPRNREAWLQIFEASKQHHDWRSRELASRSRLAAQKEKDRATTASNRVHQLHCSLNRIIGEAISSILARTPSEGRRMKEVSRLCSQLKKRFLAELSPQELQSAHGLHEIEEHFRAQLEEGLQQSDS